MVAVELLIVIAAAIALGFLARLAKLPDILGMIIGGALASTLFLPLGEPGASVALGDVSSWVRTGVLVIVLLRAGLGLDLGEVRRAGGLALGLGSVPLLADAAMITAGGHLLLGLPWVASLVLGFLVAAISPAIVIPGMLDILGRRQGEARRLPTALLTGAPLDNILAVLLLGVTLDLALAEAGSVGATLMLVPVSVLGGVAVGVGGGLVVGWTIRRGRLSKPLATMSILAVGWLLVPLASSLGLSYVLGTLALGVTARRVMAGTPGAPSEGLATAGGYQGASEGLATVWSYAKYGLFGLIGAAVDLGPLADVGLLAVAVVVLGQLARAGGSWLVTSVNGLSGRERLAGALAYIPKATIQAAFAALPLDRGLPEGAIVLGVAVLAVVVTAPLGVVALERGTDKLLPLGDDGVAPLPADEGVAD